MFNDDVSRDCHNCCINTVYTICVINDSTMVHLAAIIELHIACFTVIRLAQQNDGGQLSEDQTCACQYPCAFNGSDSSLPWSYHVRLVISEF